MGNFGSKDGEQEHEGELHQEYDPAHAHGAVPAPHFAAAAMHKAQPKMGEQPQVLDGKHFPVQQMETATFDEDDEVVPTVFRWEHGGRNVYITGTFNNWERQIPMHRSGNDFTYIHNLKKGKHAFKFVVDDEWRFAPDQPTVADIEGRINNFIDVSDFKPYMGDDDFFKHSKERMLPEHEFSQVIPDLDEYTKEPPALPPHLRHIILNKNQYVDPQLLPVPQRVSLTHLYCTAIKDNMMVLGMTHRYKAKHVTTVFYSITPQSTVAFT